ncbi:MAG: hypothetical protein QOI66_2191 [Myxococcales bacterium]|jgi:hypothetical protein|nr:hypothetical protein [Myxococcales bacterium]
MNDLIKLTTLSTRREMLLRTLFGAGCVGLRALATGLPLSFLLRPREALADGSFQCGDKSKAQYLILSSSFNGDPVNGNAPGSYDFPDIPHAADPRVAPTPIKLGAQTVTGAQVWSTLPPWVLDRTNFFHHATLTNNHPNLPKVMRLMGATAKQEMLPSIAAKYLAPCFGTVQTEPISIGAGEFLTFDGRGLPNLNPTGLRDVLTHPQGPLMRLQKLRDASLDQMNVLLKEHGTAAQRGYLDNLVASRQQARSLSDSLLSTLDSITTNDATGQITAAVTLIRMNVSPVVVIHIPFGGDNHSDPGLLKSEVPQTETGVQQIGSLMTTLQQQNLQDQVTFAMYNVFGRTLVKKGTTGRDHWASHHTTVMIGKGIRGGMTGGLEPKAGDYYAQPLDSRTGKGVSGGGDIPFAETLGAMGKTLGAALGVAGDVLDQNIAQGKIVTGALV